MAQLIIKSDKGPLISQSAHEIDKIVEEEEEEE